jgi:hypothetical protein
MKNNSESSILSFSYCLVCILLIPELLINPVFAVVPKAQVETLAKRLGELQALLNGKLPPSNLFKTL